MRKVNLKLFIFSILLTTGFFGFWENSRAEYDHPVINEIQTAGIKADDEFIELYNPTDQDVDLSDWSIQYRGYNGTKYYRKNFIKNSFIKANNYFLIAHKAFSGTTLPDMSHSTFSLASSEKAGGTVFLVKMQKDLNEISPDLAIIDKVGYGLASEYETLPAHKSSANQSIERKNFQDTDNNSADFNLLSTPTPRSSLYKDSESDSEPIPESEPEIKSYSGKIKINEIYPEPKTGEKEFVEFYNADSEAVDLAGWKLRDENLIKKENKYCVVPDELKIESKKYGVFYLENCSKNSIALNNGGDAIELSSPDNNLLDSVTFGKANKKSYSLNSENNIWQWTSKITKDVKNEFDEILTGKIKKDENIYAGVYASFEAKTGEKIKKFTWSFGDGHKSYLQKTRHKYEKSGDYNATLKISGDGEENILNFIVSVENFKKTKVQIISFLPNPAGKDSDNEWIEIFNNTKKKVNLKNWSIATGWKKLSNHPIRKDFILKPKETKKLTRDLCAFALGNKKAKIELRYPNGKAADKIKYDRKKDSVDEDEIYQKEGKKWQWITTRTNADTTPTNTETILTGTDATRIDEDEMLIDAENKIEEMDLSDLGKYSADPNQKNKQKKQIALLFAGSNIDPKEKILQNQERVLGISATKKTYTKPAEENNSQNFMGKIWKKVNARVNRMMDAF